MIRGWIDRMGDGLFTVIAMLFMLAVIVVVGIVAALALLAVPVGIGALLIAAAAWIYRHA